MVISNLEYLIDCVLWVQRWMCARREVKIVIEEIIYRNMENSLKIIMILMILDKKEKMRVMVRMVLKVVGM